MRTALFSLFLTLTLISLETPSYAIGGGEEGLRQEGVDANSGADLTKTVSDSERPLGMEMLPTSAGAH